MPSFPSHNRDIPISSYSSLSMALGDSPCVGRASASLTSVDAYRYEPYSSPCPSLLSGYSTSPGGSSSGSLPTTPTASPGNATKGRRTRRIAHSRSRNVQHDVDPVQLSITLKGDTPTCPVCDHVPSSRKTSDLLRHVKTHTGKNKWVCCGVLAADGSIEAYNYAGLRMKGGCLGTFARKDALARHLDKSSQGCIGDLDLADLLTRM